MMRNQLVETEETESYVARGSKGKAAKRSTAAAEKQEAVADGADGAEWSGEAADVELVREMYELWLHGSPIILPPRAERGEINVIKWWNVMPLWADEGFERIPDATGAISTK